MRGVFATPVFIFERWMPRHPPPDIVVEREGDSPKEFVERMFAHCLALNSTTTPRPPLAITR
jgi:hypothetical protein